MTLNDIERMVDDETVIRIYNREGELIATEIKSDNRFSPVDRMCWERATITGKYRLLPLVKVYLT